MLQRQGYQRDEFDVVNEKIETDPKISYCSETKIESETESNGF